MTTKVQSGSALQWVGPASQEIVKFGTNLEGMTTVLDGLENIFDWMKYFDWDAETADQVGNDLHKINDTLSIPQFISSLNTIRTEWSNFYHSDLSTSENQNASSKLVKSIAESGIHLAKSIFSLQDWNVLSLKTDRLYQVKNGFWGCIGLTNAIEVLFHMDELANLRKNLDVVFSPQVRNVLEHKVQLNYLHVLKSVSFIAMAAISLISLVFGSLATGFIFSVPVFLTLSSISLILTFTTHFYGKVIEYKEKQVEGLKA